MPTVPKSKGRPPPSQSGQFWESVSLSNARRVATPRTFRLTEGWLPPEKFMVRVLACAPSTTVVGSKVIWKLQVAPGARLMHVHMPWIWKPSLSPAGKIELACAPPVLVIQMVRVTATPEVPKSTVPWPQLGQPGESLMASSAWCVAVPVRSRVAGPVPP